MLKLLLCKITNVQINNCRYFFFLEIQLNYEAHASNSFKSSSSSGLASVKKISSI